MMFESKIKQGTDVYVIDLSLGIVNKKPWDNSDALKRHLLLGLVWPTPMDAHDQLENINVASLHDYAEREE